MARPRMQPGDVGNITITGHRGAYTARAYVCTNSGHRRRISASGPTKGAARNAFTARAKIIIATGGTVNLTPSSTVEDAAAQWWPTVEARDLRRQTIDQYRHYADIIRGDLKGLELHQLTAGRLNDYVTRRARDDGGEVRRSVAKGLKLQLVSFCGWLVRRDLLPHNPARDVDIPDAVIDPVRALTPAEVEELRADVAAWQVDHPRVETPIARIVDLMLGTGARISEVLALRWQDIDLGADMATVTISGTLVIVAGRNVERQDFTKTDAGYRVVTLPPFSTATLLDMRVNADGEKVFPSRAGTWRSPHNVRRTWRECRGDKWKWVTPHYFRKTVATALYRELGGRDAASQLGHVDSAVTLAHYVQRAHVAPDVSNILQSFYRPAPAPGAAPAGPNSDESGQ